jgi:hypothetical protein
MPIVGWKELSRKGNMKLQYIHFRKKDLSTMEATLALQAPDKTFLEKLFITHSNATLLPSGVSILSPKDRFIKKVGREVAEKRLTYVKFYLDTVTQDGTTHIYRLYTNDMIVDNKEFHVSVLLTTVAESEYVRLISADIQPINGEKI